MRTILTLLTLSAMVLCAADEFPELRTLDGKVYKQVKVMKSDAAEIRIMHTDGFAILPLSTLPPDVLARFGGKADKNVEELAVMQRKLDRTRSYYPPEESAPKKETQSVTALDVLASAINNRSLIRLSYDNGAEGKRLIEPHFVGTTNDGNLAVLGWFLEGASKSNQGDGWRVYRLDKITSIEVLPETFAEARSGYDPEYAGIFKAWYARLPASTQKPSAEHQRQTQLAKAYAASTGRTYEECLRAVVTWEWCSAHPQGSVVQGVSYDAAATAQQLAMAHQVLTTRAVAAVPGAAGAGRAIESRIDGDFEGFEGEKVFKLMNGQVWQQMDFTYHYFYSYAPRVMIYQAGGATMMKVDGIERAVRVMPLR